MTFGIKCEGGPEVFHHGTGRDMQPRHEQSTANNLGHAEHEFNSLDALMSLRNVTKIDLHVLHNRSYHVSNHFSLGFTKVVYGPLYLLVYHQYSLVNEIGPPHKRDTFA